MRRTQQAVLTRGVRGVAAALRGSWAGTRVLGGVVLHLSVPHVGGLALGKLSVCVCTLIGIVKVERLCVLCVGRGFRGEGEKAARVCTAPSWWERCFQNHAAWQAGRCRRGKLASLDLRVHSLASPT